MRLGEEAVSLEEGKPSIRRRADSSVQVSGTQATLHSCGGLGDRRALDMLTKYLQAAMRLAKYEIQENGDYSGSIPGLEGAWASASSLEACREEPEEVLEDWLLFRLSRQLPILSIVH
jgi:predicted RNase H-like HicB family nuclease